MQRRMISGGVSIKKSGTYQSLNSVMRRSTRVAMDEENTVSFIKIAMFTTVKRLLKRNTKHEKIESMIKYDK